MSSSNTIPPSDMRWPDELDPEQVRDAALVVCGHAHDRADARMLLDVLGLLGDGVLAGPRIPRGLWPRSIKQVTGTGGSWKGYVQ